MIPYGRHCLDEDDIRAVVDVLRGGLLTQGPMVEAFEDAVAAYVGAKHAVAVSSCTAALHLAAMVVDLGPGQSLVTSPITFVASANAAAYRGARARFADIDPVTLNLSPDSLSEALSRERDVRMVIPVHLAGLPCDMPAIRAAADRGGAVVVEDAAHALGSTYPDGARVGSCPHSLMTAFSFHPVKAIASGEGGMITTNDSSVYRRLLRLRSHGINKLDDPIQVPSQAVTSGVANPWYYEMQELGYHYRITDIQSALGHSQLTKLDRFIGRRRELARVYDDAFSAMRWIRPAQPVDEGRTRSAHHIYLVRIDYAGLGRSRADVMLALRARGIVTQVHYIPVPAQPYYRALGERPEAYPHAWKYYQEALTIPLFVGLSDAQQQDVIAAMTDVLA
jgi:perosamine synthetase